MNITKQMAGDVALPVFQFNGEDVNVKIKKDALTMKFLNIIRQLQNEEDMEPLAELLADKVTGWDITETVNSKEVPFPITAATFYDRVPFEFIVKIIEAIAGVMSGNAQKPSK